MLEQGNGINELIKNACTADPSDKVARKLALWKIYFFSEHHKTTEGYVEAVLMVQNSTFYEAKQR